MTVNMVTQLISLLALKDKNSRLYLTLAHHGSGFQQYNVLLQAAQVKFLILLHPQVTRQLHSLNLFSTDQARSGATNRQTILL